MSHPDPAQRQPTPPEVDRYLRVVHNVALAAVVACPIIAVLPPRKLDFYTLSLVGITGFSADYLIRESTGKSIWQHASGQPPRPKSKAQLKQQPSIIGELQKQERGSESSRESWKIQRQKEIREDVEEGKGFGEMIMDQIWEVWNQGKTKDEDD